MTRNTTAGDAMTSSDLPLLALRGISKRFAGVQALELERAT
jgi:hypothetical protein